MKMNLPIEISTRVLITDTNTGEILVDKANAINSVNMSRIISRALAHETNSWIKSMAFGNGGSFITADGSTIFNPPNVDSWDSRLYNETFRQVVDESDIDFGTDPGSSDQNVTRPGGGASPADDPSGGGVISQEVGLKSNVIVTVFLNQNEPNGQSISSLNVPTPNEECFAFDEIGLYSPGKPAKATNGYTTVNVGNKTSENFINLSPGEVYNFIITIDGTPYSADITVPLSGSGPGGEITYGDFCEGLNTGAWVSGDAIDSYVYTYITDASAGTYPSIIDRQSYGYLIFQSKTAGSTSEATVGCRSIQPDDLMNVLTSGLCANCNILTENGENAGVQNDPINTQNERERLLTHLIFDPILKSVDRALSISYTLTISVAKSADATVEVLTD